MTLVSRKPGAGRITWVCPNSGSMGGWGVGPSLVAQGEGSRALCAFSNRMSSLRRGCPAAMPPSIWRERTSSTLSAGQPGPEADILQSRGRRGPTLRITVSCGEWDCQIENSARVPDCSFPHPHSSTATCPSSRSAGGPCSPVRMPKVDVPFPSTEEMDHSSKLQCRVLLETDMDGPQGKRGKEGYV